MKKEVHRVSRQARAALFFYKNNAFGKIQQKITSTIKML